MRRHQCDCETMGLAAGNSSRFCVVNGEHVTHGMRREDDDLVMEQGADVDTVENHV